jgi:hypothetical protein
MSTGLAITVAILTALPTWNHAYIAKEVVVSINLKKKLKYKSSKTNGSAVCVMKYKVSIGLKNAVNVGNHHLRFQQGYLRYCQKYLKLSQMQLKKIGCVTTVH